jgi:AcrR family transcriptional regulator
MTDQIELQRLAPVPMTEDDSAKRRQIIDGARRTFLSQGFDAASMGEIAKAAGVSKGTLYVYFQNKEQLFSAIVDQECVMQAEGLLAFDPADHDVEGVLTRFGNAYTLGLCVPERLSAVRAVVSIADRMPEAGKIFYEHGPARGIAALAAYFKALNDAGVLKVDDCEIAAAMFLDACHATLLKPVLFNYSGAPDPSVSPTWSVSPCATSSKSTAPDPLAGARPNASP